MTDQATQDAPTLPDRRPAVAGQVERVVGRPAPKRADGSPMLRVVPCSLREAQRFVANLHRHHKDQPLPPNALDFASAAQFWSLFSDLTSQLLSQRGLTKAFDFIHVLLARVDSADAATDVVRRWIGQTYAEKVLPVEIPKTTVTGVASAEFGTVYDVARYDGSSRTFKRARDAYDSFVGHIEGSIRQSWARQLRQE